MQYYYVLSVNSFVSILGEKGEKEVCWEQANCTLNSIVYAGFCNDLLTVFILYKILIQESWSVRQLHIKLEERPSGQVDNYKINVLKIKSKSSVATEAKQGSVCRIRVTYFTSFH